MNSNSLVIKQKQKQKKIYNEDQAKKFCSIRKIGFRYSYFTVRIMTNDPLVSIARQGNNHS